MARSTDDAVFSNLHSDHVNIHWYIERIAARSRIGCPKHAAQSSGPVVDHTDCFFFQSLYFPLNALVGSYQVFPPGHFPFLGDAANSVAKATEYSFSGVSAGNACCPDRHNLADHAGSSESFLTGPTGLQSCNARAALGGIFLLALLLKSMLSVWTHAASAGLVLLPGYGLVH